MKRSSLLTLSTIVLLLLSCKLVNQTISGPQPSPTGSTFLQEEPTPGLNKGFGEVIFCQDVTDNGEPVKPGASFPSGTQNVWAYFTYQGMSDGEAWGRVWERNGEILFEARDQAWEDGESGWLAYSVFDSGEIPLGGHYTLALYIGDVAVQRASFDVTMPEIPEPSDEPALGAITFASGITEDRVPVGPASQFNPGIRQVYAVFSYANLPADQTWGYEWLLEGETISSFENTWGEGPVEGITYIYYERENGLLNGIYQLNLTLDGQVVQSAQFELLSGPVIFAEAATPEEIIDPDLLPAWQMLYNASDQYNFLHDIAQFALDHHIEIRMDEEANDSTAGYYSRNTESCQPNYRAGKLYIYRTYWNNHSWEEVASVIAHELTHAYQHWTGDYRCPGCSIEAEYFSFVAEMYTLIMLGREDIYFQYDVFDTNGKVDPNRIWYKIKQAYGDYCPDY